MNVVKLRQGMRRILLYLRKRMFFLICICVFILSFYSSSAGAYSLGEPADSFNNTAKSFFNQNPLQFSPIDVTKFIGNDPQGLALRDLINAGGFSSSDIGASVRAVLILFIRLIITTLNTTLGILKVLLEVL